MVKNFLKRTVNRLAVLALFHIYPVKLFHKPHSVLIDFRLCFRPRRIEIVFIPGKMLAECFRNLTAAGIMHTNKSYLFLIHR